MIDFCEDDEELEVVKNAIKYIKNFFMGESSGHDFYHSIRVFRTAKSIAQIEEKTQDVNKKIVYLAALLHDVDDYKLSPETYQDKSNAEKFLKSNNISDEEINLIKNIISEVSFLGKDTVKPKTIEGMIVQDADRLDAIGAIGISRTFAFGGKNGRAIFNPDEKPKLNMGKDDYKNNNSSTINHFYEKLLILKDLMNTDSAKAIAEKRTIYMQNFLSEFFDEWNGLK